MDIARSWGTLVPAFEGANTVLSLVGVLHGSPQQFEQVQLHGAENVARAAKEVGARLVHLSAIGANEFSEPRDFIFSRCNELILIQVLYRISGRKG